ncbi:S-adenosyl-L-methionine-dependent methyltransferase [Patellaria atrata CBS 101060]|uniref:S-adenosyl-L-methionine-dependent methyltransferase n=1 Tax=Patellaria atrata CBS 101060 TaxID=1346257 RepID=A0A9P4VNJ8_9PEZI|nr:S-adenosyl-L-methionine-dependent methyltransferase [Patellaria atrata CBS 101060]
MSVTEANRKMFDEMAASYDIKPWQLKIGAQISTAFLSSIPWLDVAGLSVDSPDNDSPEHKVRLLDYACGTGAVSRALEPYVDVIRGIDLSSGMVEIFTRRFAEDRESAEKAGEVKRCKDIRAVVGDLFASPPELQLGEQEEHEGEFLNFDIVTVAGAYHHFEDVALATKRLVERLRPGGVLAVVDFLHGEGENEHAHHHHHHHGHGHEHQQNSGKEIDEQHKAMLPETVRKAINVFGFDENGMRALFEESGLTDFGFKVMEEKLRIEFDDKEMFRTWFLAKGRKPL